MIQPISGGQAASRRQLAGPAGEHRRRDRSDFVCFFSATASPEHAKRPAGKCFCLYPEDRQLPMETQPRILESAITPTVLFLKRMEIAGIRHCDFIDRPGRGGQAAWAGGRTGGWASIPPPTPSPLIMNFTSPRLAAPFPSNRQALLLGSEPWLTSSDSSPFLWAFFHS